MSVPKGKNLFDESGVVSDDIVSLSMGAPGGEHLKSAALTISRAASELMVGGLNRVRSGAEQICLSARINSLFFFFEGGGRSSPSVLTLPISFRVVCTSDPVFRDNFSNFSAFESGFQMMLGVPPMRLVDSW